MRAFQEIFEISAGRHGGAEALEAKLGRPKSAAELAAIPEDRWLAEMSKFVFRTGLNWSVIENKWPGFEEAFHGFDIGRCALMDDVMFDALLTDTRIVRHGAKIASVRDNAALMLELREEGGIGKVVGEWPSEDYAALLEMLKTRGSRLGGTTGAYALRFMGRDGYVLSKDVVARLIAEGVVDKAPTSKSAMKAVQTAFSTWMAQSGRSLTEISRVLAMSIG
ncbi:DNA-3-methyladenine glycosylase I [uncultured Roseovarius sp.]|uniref:DNA-3-methyladenine glycosylase I n=1 Tax=uncultured Roseovarius sp. TaxID=293344 RepID=UPI00262817C8|nr:DNA-3-methyladenine glycosylase I [uncultured Roseovarius sp.]